MAKFVNITGEDTIRDTVKVTAGFFTGNVGTVAGSALATASLSSGQGEYYYTLQKSSEDQFSVAYVIKLDLDQVIRLDRHRQFINNLVQCY